MARIYSNILEAHSLQKSNLGMETIPKDVFEHPHLEKLDLSYNQLTTLDERIGHLKHLKYLDLSNNALQTLPASLGDLEALEVLVLSNNPWQEFPIVITTLKQLKVLKIKGQQLSALPPSIGNLDNLESLDLAFQPLEDLPFSLSMLERLTELVCTSNQFQALPDVLLEMPQLVALELLDLEFRLKLPLERLRLFFKVLKHLKKQRASLATKKVAFALFFEQGYEADLALVFPLLLVNYVEFSRLVRSHIFNRYAAPITEDSVVSILGKTTWIDLDTIVNNVTLTTSIQEDTTHVVLGRHLTKQQLNHLHDGMHFVSEKTLLDFLTPQQPANWLEEHRNNLMELLLSEHNENIALALQLAKDNALLDELLTELLIAYTHVDAGNSSLRNEIKEVFYLRIPDFETLTLPSASFRFYTPHKSEHAILQGLKNICHQTPKWDGMKIAHRLFEQYGAAYTYILTYSSIEKEAQWLQQFVKGNRLILSPLSKLKALPKSLGQFPQVKVLNLESCGFRKFPNVELLAQLPNLEQIDLRKNPISFIPKGIYSQVAQYQILLTKGANRIKR